MSQLVNEFTDANFENDVTNSDIPVLVDFWATGAGHVRQLPLSLKK